MYKIIGVDQSEYGPVSGEELRRWRIEGRVDARTLVKAEGTNEWKPLSAFPEFAAPVAAGGTAPPVLAATAGPVKGDAFTQQILAGESDINIGRCLAGGWTLLLGNFGLLFGGSALIWICNLVLRFIPFGALLLSGVLQGGLYLVYLKRIRGQPASVGEVFAGFKLGFVQLFLAGLLTNLLAGFGYLFCVLPGIYLQIAWIFSLALVADQRLEFWSAMELSRRVVSRVWFKVFALVLIAFAPVLLFTCFVIMKTVTVVVPFIESLAGGPPDPAKIKGFITEMMTTVAPLNLIAFAILLINLPFAFGALMYAYEALFGPRSRTS